jgi:hypothetical protein
MRVFPNSDLEAQRKMIRSRTDFMLKTLDEVRGAKTKIEAMRDQATIVEAELKAVTLTLTEFDAIQNGSKRQETMRKEIQRLKRLQSQRKAEIESLEVFTHRGFIRLASFRMLSLHFFMSHN